MKISDKILGGRFKFDDYYMGAVGHTFDPIDPRKMTPAKMIEHCSIKSIKTDLADMLDSCPFRK